VRAIRAERSEGGAAAEKDGNETAAGRRNRSRQEPFDAEELPARNLDPAPPGT